MRRQSLRLPPAAAVLLALSAALPLAGCGSSSEERAALPDNVRRLLGVIEFNPGFEQVIEMPFEGLFPGATAGELDELEAGSRSGWILHCRQDNEAGSRGPVIRTLQLDSGEAAARALQIWRSQLPDGLEPEEVGAGEAQGFLAGPAGGASGWVLAFRQGAAVVSVEADGVAGPAESLQHLSLIHI